MKYYLWNMFANIRNGQSAKKSFIVYPRNKICASILNVLWEEGFISGYQISIKNPKMFEIFLKYKNGEPVIKKLQSVSKPGRRIYYSSKQLWKINSNVGLFIFSTNKGIMSIENCKKQNLGGELFFIIK